MYGYWRFSKCNVPCSRCNALILRIKRIAHVVVVGFLMITILSQYKSKNIESIAINIINAWILACLSLRCRVHVVMHKYCGLNALHMS